MTHRGRFRLRPARAVVAALLLAATSLSLTAVAPQQAIGANGDIGVEGRSFRGASGSPTADKPQSKLWFHAGRWWACMFDSRSRDWHIFKLNRARERWVDTGIPIDNRRHSLADALWDGQHLYIASHYATVSSKSSPKASIKGKPARLYRYSYSTTAHKFRLDSGFPVRINGTSSESLTIDEDTTGTLWATWTTVSGSLRGGYTSQVYVNSSDGSDSSWGKPLALPVSGSEASSDDISAVVAYAHASIGVLWSNQEDGTFYWATHRDGEPKTDWHGSVAIQGSKQSDDHINLKTLQSDPDGRVYAAVKTSFDELTSSTSSSPQIELLVFKPGTGSWSSYPIGTLADCHTRPIVMLDESNSLVHVFATAPSNSGCSHTGEPGTIYEKSAPLDNPVFGSGRGTPVIRDASSPYMNNVTSTKQAVSDRSGLVVLASNTSTKRYWHADLSLGP